MAMKMGRINNRPSGMGRCHSEKLKAAKINGSRMAHPMKNPVATNLTKLPKLIPDFVILIFIFCWTWNSAAEFIRSAGMVI